MKNGKSISTTIFKLDTKLSPFGLIYNLILGQAVPPPLTN